MRTNALLRYVFVVVADASILAAFALDGAWLIVLAPVAQMAFWLALRRHSMQWRSSFLLAGHVVLATSGVLLGFSTALLLTATAAALAAWDQVIFGATLKYASGAESIDRLNRSHLRSLSLALITGMLLAGAGLGVRLDLPFPIVAVLALALVVSLARAMRSITLGEG